MTVEKRAARAEDNFAEPGGGAMSRVSAVAQTGPNLRECILQSTDATPGLV